MKRRGARALISPELPEGFWRNTFKGQVKKGEGFWVYCQLLHNSLADGEVAEWCLRGEHYQSLGSRAQAWGCVLLVVK